MKVGDKVKFLNDTGGGTIKKIENNLAYVEIEEGFIVPVILDELLVINHIDFDITKQLTKPTSTKPSEISSSPKITTTITTSTKNIEKKNIEQEDIYIAFVPHNLKQILNSDIDIYIINNLKNAILFNYAIETDEGHISIATGNLESGTKQLIETQVAGTFNQLKNITIQAIRYRKIPYTLQEPIDNDIKINPVRFFKQGNFITTTFFNSPTLLIPVIKNANLNHNEFIHTNPKPKPEDHFIVNNYTKQKRNTELLEVDLHIEKLIEDAKGLTNSDMLNIQMKHFYNNMEQAILEKIKKIVFIHGVGNGTLKQEIRKALDKDYPDVKYQDASFKEYGYGATLVIL